MGPGEKKLPETKEDFEKDEFADDDAYIDLLIQSSEILYNEEKDDEETAILEEFGY